MFPRQEENKNWRQLRFLSHSPEVLYAPGSPSLLCCQESHWTPIVTTKETQCKEVNENLHSSSVHLKHPHVKGGKGHALTLQTAF